MKLLMEDYLTHGGGVMDAQHDAAFFVATHGMSKVGRRDEELTGNMASDPGPDRGRGRASTDVLHRSPRMRLRTVYGTLFRREGAATSASDPD